MSVQNKLDFVIRHPTASACYLRDATPEAPGGVRTSPAASAIGRALLSEFQPAMGHSSAKEYLLRFETIIRANDDVMGLLRRLREIRLPEWRLVAGCLYQTVWNALTRRPPGTGIKDYDLIYFDKDDLSWEAEDAAIRRVTEATASCVGPVEVRNQARVHLWFETRFGIPFSPLACADEALLRYASIVHAVGVRLEDDGRLDILAPFGMDDLFTMIIRPNRALNNAASHAQKALRVQAIWPEVTVIPWEREEAGQARTQVGPA